MKNIKAYRFLSYTLLPVAGALAIVGLLGLMAALMNPSVLLVIFVIFCVVVYVISSFIFLQKGIEQGRQCKASLKDLIKVNAYGTILFCVVCLWQSINLLLNPTLTKSLMAQAIAAQSNFPKGAENTFVTVLFGFLYFLMVASFLLVVHLYFSLKALKTFGHLFEKK